MTTIKTRVVVAVGNEAPSVALHGRGAGVCVLLGELSLGFDSLDHAAARVRDIQTALDAAREMVVAPAERSAG